MEKDKLELLQSVLEAVAGADLIPQLAQKLAPIVRQTGQEIKPLLDDFLKYMRQNRIESILHYQQQLGITREEAIDITLDDLSAIRRHFSHQRRSEAKKS